MNNDTAASVPLIAVTLPRTNDHGASISTPAVAGVADSVRLMVS